ncbi:unnamed protein product [Agarophyton chilense]
MTGRSVRLTPRAELSLEPGIPSGVDPQENAPLRYYKSRPMETYEKRSFATTLPRNWAGEDNTIGSGDIEIDPRTKVQVFMSREIQVPQESTSAFLEYSMQMKEEREKALQLQKEQSEKEQTGRATCGEEEGKELVSNYRTILVDGVKAVEYWGEPNGPVPRLFGGPSA